MLPVHVNRILGLEVSCCYLASMPYGQFLSVFSLHQIFFKIFHIFSYFSSQVVSFKICSSKLSFIQLRVQLLHLLVFLRTASAYLTKVDWLPNKVIDRATLKNKIKSQVLLTHDYLHRVKREQGKVKSCLLCCIDKNSAKLKPHILACCPCKMLSLSLQLYGFLSSL